MNHVVLVGLGWGDEAKGSVVDALVRERDTKWVVRFNGGGQTAHNVVLPDGRHHTFSQFGSGTFAGARTFLSRFCLIDPLRFTAEAEHLQQVGIPDPYSLVTIDEEALLVTPYHQEVNRAREAERPPEDRHGSCGVGIGETMRYAIAHPGEEPRIGDLRHPRRLREQLTLLRERALGDYRDLFVPAIDDLMEPYRLFAKVMDIDNGERLGDHLSEPVIFEGAQGALLDEWFGLAHPYTTWSTTTPANAQFLLHYFGHTDIETIGVLRTYATRHGNGPFPTEDPTLAPLLPEAHNGHGRYQGAWRVGHFDAAATRYAIDACGGIDTLAVTHLDRIHPHIHACYAYDGTQLAHHPTHDLERMEALGARLKAPKPLYRPGAHTPTEWCDRLETTLEVPILLTSDGPTHQHKHHHQPAV